MKFYDINNKLHTIDIEGVNTNNWSVTSANYSSVDTSDNINNRIIGQTLSFSVIADDSNKQLYTSSLVGKTLTTSEFPNISETMIADNPSFTMNNIQIKCHFATDNSLFAIMNYDKEVVINDKYYARFIHNTNSGIVYYYIEEEQSYHNINPSILWGKNDDDTMYPIVSKYVSAIKYYDKWYSPNLSKVGKIRRIKLNKDDLLYRYVALDHEIKAGNTTYGRYYVGDSLDREWSEHPKLDITENEDGTFVAWATNYQVDPIYSVEFGEYNDTPIDKISTWVKAESMRAYDTKGVWFTNDYGHDYFYLYSSELYGKNYKPTEDPTTKLTLVNVADPTDKHVIKKVTINNELLWERPQYNGQPHKFHIVSNLNNMPMNDPSETITIEAVDYLTYTKTLRYETIGYERVSDILYKIIGQYTDLGGWATSDFANFEINLDNLREDDGNTYPTMYKVLETTLAYINRSIIYTANGFVLFDPQAIDTEGFEFDKQHLADVTISIADPATSYTITSEYKDLDQEGVKTTWNETPQEGTITPPSSWKKSNLKYVAYVGYDDGCQSFDNHAKQYIEYEEPNIDKLGQEGTTYNSSTCGSCHINIASDEVDNTGDVEGVRKLSDYMFLWGLKNYEKDYYPYPNGIYTHTIYTDHIVNDDLYLLLNESFFWTDEPIPVGVGAHSFRIFGTGIRPYRKLKITLTYDDLTWTEFERRPITTMNKITVDAGTQYEYVNNVYWRHNAEKEGYIVNLVDPIGATNSFNGTTNIGKIIKKVEVLIYPEMCWSVDYDADNDYKYYPVVPYKFCWSDFEAELFYRPLVDDDVVDTNSVIKWINDNESYNGETKKEQPKIVTFDGKKYANNCVLDSYSSNGYAGKYNNTFAGEDGSTLMTSEECRLNMYARQYGTNSTIMETTLINYPINATNNHTKIFKNKYLNKLFNLTMYDYDVVNDSTKVKLIERK